MRTCRVVALGIMFLSVTQCPALAAEKPSDEQERKESLAGLSKLAASYEIRLGNKRVATREADPALRWINTAGHATDAVLYVWTHEGRPVAVGATFIMDHTAMGQELQSLALEPLQAWRGGKKVWNPPEPGIEFLPVPDAPAPAETSRQRLSQIKTLARRFRAQAIKGPPVYQVNTALELRLLSQPVLQYHDAKMPDSDGVLFAFATDTDPDLVLLIENRNRDDKAGWEYALARSNPSVLNVWYDEKLVWSKKRLKTTDDPEQSYFIAYPFPVKTTGP